jgi:hypothetical protein
MKVQTKTMKTASKLVMMSKLAVSVHPGKATIPLMPGPTVSPGSEHHAAMLASAAVGLAPALNSLPAAGGSDPDVAAPPAPARGMLARMNSKGKTRKNSEWGDVGGGVGGVGGVGGGGADITQQWHSLAGGGDANAANHVECDPSTIEPSLLNTIFDDEDGEGGEKNSSASSSPLCAISSKAERYASRALSGSDDTGKFSPGAGPDSEFAPDSVTVAWDGDGHPLSPDLSDS